MTFLNIESAKEAFITINRYLCKTAKNLLAKLLMFLNCIQAGFGCMQVKVWKKDYASVKKTLVFMWKLLSFSLAFKILPTFVNSYQHREQEIIS